MVYANTETDATRDAVTSKLAALHFYQLALPAPKARAVWSDITPIARTDWIHWITSAKQAETRVRFPALENRYPLAERAKGYLLALDALG